MHVTCHMIKMGIGLNCGNSHFTFTVTQTLLVKELKQNQSGDFSSSSSFFFFFFFFFFFLFIQCLYLLPYLFWSYFYSVYLLYVLNLGIWRYNCDQIWFSTLTTLAIHIQMWETWKWTKNKKKTKQTNNKTEQNKTKTESEQIISFCYELQCINKWFLYSKRSQLIGYLPW